MRRKEWEREVFMDGLQTPIPLHSLGEEVEKTGVKSKVQPGKNERVFWCFLILFINATLF